MKMTDIHQLPSDKNITMIDDLEAALAEVERLKADLLIHPPKPAFCGAFPFRVERLLEAERHLANMLS